MRIRSYRPEDLGSLYEICLRTGSAGRDATHLVEDPKLFGELYVAPYAVLEPEHAFVLDAGTGGAVGYVVGALDTEAFEARCESEWWPALRDRYPLQPDGTRLDDLLVHLLHHPSRSPRAVVGKYPSHLHIDLLPQAQSNGWGRRLMDTLFDALRADGSTGVHWGVSTSNEPAVAFYRHLGCTELSADTMLICFGRQL